jgi:hypothetical protein
MKYSINYRLKYKNRTLDKRINISKVIGETHAKQVLTTHLRIKHSKMINFEVLSINENG